MQKRGRNREFAVRSLRAVGSAIGLAVVSLAVQAQVITRPDLQPQKPVAESRALVVVVFDRPVTSRSLQVSGQIWDCSGNRCESRLSQPGASMEVCQALARSVGFVQFFGTPADAFDPEQLAACNTALPPKLTAPAAVSPLPSTRPEVTQPQQQPVAPEQPPPVSGVVVPVRPRPAPPQEKVTAKFDYRHEPLNPTTRRLRGVFFEDRSIGDVAKRRWSFGDGTSIDNIPDPVHAYPEEGFYRACLTVAGSGDPRIRAPLQSSTCQILYTDVMAQLLGNFLGPVEDRLGLSSLRTGDAYNRLIRTPPFSRLSRSEREALQQLLGDPATRASEIIAFLVRMSYEHYKPYIYVYATAGADICDLAGKQPCQAGVGAVGYVYMDLVDVTQFTLRKILGLISSDPFPNSDQTRHDNYITVVVNVGASLSVGTKAGFGILLVPRPDDATIDEDFDFNRFNPNCRGEPINCLLQQRGEIMTGTLTGLGFFAGHDNSLGFETTLVGIEAATQIVRLDVDADAMLTDAMAAMRCAMDIYDRAGGLTGSRIDYARAFSEAFEVDVLANPPSFDVDCGNIRCRGPGCANTVTSLQSVRDVSWGPPVLILRTLARLLPVDVSSLSFERSGRVLVNGEAGGLLGFSIDFDPRSGAEITFGHQNLSVNVSGYETIDPIGARISGNVTLYGMNLGDVSMAVHTQPVDADWRLNLEHTLLGYVKMNYSLQSPPAESLSLKAGRLRMDVSDVVSAGASSAAFLGNVYWGSANLGTAELMVSRDSASVRFASAPPQMAKSWPDGPVRLSGTANVTGSVTLLHRSNGAESATFSGRVKTESEIHVTASDLGVDEFDFNYSFDKTLDNIEVEVDAHGNAMLPYYYPQLRWIETTLPYPCPSSCTGTIPGTNRKVTVPCPDICEKDVDIPVGVDAVTGEIHVSLW